MPNNSPFNNNLVVLDNKIKMIALQKQPIFLLNGEVIWQVSDSPLSKELHDFSISNFIIIIAKMMQLTSPGTVEDSCRS